MFHRQLLEFIFGPPPPRWHPAGSWHWPETGLGHSRQSPRLQQRGPGAAPRAPGDICVARACKVKKREGVCTGACRGRGPQCDPLNPPCPSRAQASSLPPVDTGMVLRSFFFFSWPSCVACRILVPQPGTEPVSPASEVWSLNHWTTSQVPLDLFIGLGGVGGLA